jgi:hypothetical protein
MVRLLVSRCGAAAAIRPVAGARQPILPDARAKVERCRDEGSCGCSFCGDTYLVEPDAFGDGCMTYYVGFLARRLAGEDDADE